MLKFVFNSTNTTVLNCEYTENPQRNQTRRFKMDDEYTYNKLKYYSYM